MNKAESEQSAPGQAASVSDWALTIVASEAGERVGAQLVVAGRLTIGRDPSCTLVLKDQTVSRLHAAVEPLGTALRVLDLKSGNGVWVNDRRVEHALLTPGQQFRIGSTVFECMGPAGPQVDTDVPTTFIPPPAAAAPAAPPVAQRRAFIVKIIEGSRSGAEVVVNDGVATIGRADDSTVVVTDVDVSRKHARIESSADLFTITDEGSSYGLWVGSKQVSSHLLKPGEPFRLAQSVLFTCEFVADVKPGDADVASPDATRFVPSKGALQQAPAVPRVQQASATPSVQPVATPPVQPAPARPPVQPKPATPAKQQTPAMPEALARSAAPAAAAAASSAATPPAVKPAPVAPAAPPRPAPEQAGVTDADFSHTIVMPVARQPAARRMEDEGQLVDLLAHKPLLLDDSDEVWSVVKGGVLIFTVALENGQPVGPRSHFLGILPGQCFCGMTSSEAEGGSGFLAVAKPGTQVRKISRARLRALAADPTERAAIASLIDGWVGGLSKALTADLPARRAGELPVAPGQRIELTPATKASAAEGVLWIELWSGSVTFDDLATPTFPRRSVLFPLTPDSWVEPVSDEFGALTVEPLRTVDALADQDAWHGLDAFHRVLRESEFIKRKLATVDEYLRLADKKQASAAASKAGYDAIGSVLRAEADTPQQFRATTPAEAVFQACKLVGDALGLDVKQPPATSNEDLSFEERVGIVASNSGFRTRVVALRDNWWQRDHGAMLGQIDGSKQPVALLKTSPTSYNLVGDGATRPIAAEVAAGLSPFAYTFYRPFPEGALRVSDVITFGARGLARDLRWVAAMAVVVGMTGTITPYFTGLVFDSAIPQADRSALYGFGIALVFSALATSMFKLTQGVATNRIQAQMTAGIQGAVWDRMMNLPANFFRKYSAGDLADRAAGVDAIQDLVAGAGVAAILGSISGLFFVVQMFSYNLRLALLAILLTIVYVGFNMAANYGQLRYQRVEIQFRGRITGLVLNLITGVAKLRICGAEQHAFRVWAEQFAQQRRISFRVGMIQNVVAVFGAIYPVISSIAIFSLVIAEQQRMAASDQAGLTTGDFIAFNAAFGLFLAAMQALGDASLSLLRVVPIYERLLPVLDTPPEVDRSKAAPGKLTGLVELSHVHFRYDPDGPFIVKDVSLKIKPGEFVALVGASGCGKSTLMRLMLGFEHASSGSIYYDGQDLSSLDIRLVRQQLGVVMQQSRVMPTEIYRNIIGAASRTIEDAWDAAEKAGLADDVRNMPMGMHTYVSEGGGTLSGGQRQRLMIARAIVNKPKIIFLDEATSALDNRTQAIVTESMDKMSATRVVIAHRLSTVINANRICYLEGGQIVESGTYQELMDQNGKFAELARRQVA